MAIRRRTGLIVLGIAAVLLLALIFIGPALISVDRYKPQLISYLQEKTGKQVEIGRLALTFFPISIRIDYFGVKNPLQSACKRAGLPRINWHALRHTHGTLLHVQGTPLKVAQAQLGHSHMATTLEVYTHASVIAQREAVNLLDEQVFPSVPKNADGSRSSAGVVSPTN